MTFVNSPTLVHRTSPEHTYASWNVLSLKSIPNFFFNIINSDLYSEDGSLIQSQFYNIVKHAKESTYSGFPIFITGMINEKTPSVKELMEKTYKNVLKMDSNNEALSKNTFHNKGTFSDGLERDYILMNDPNTMVRTNYARILSKFDSKHFSHYPVMGIFSIR